MRIAHTADIHWRGLTRHQEYRQVFERFYTECRDRQVDIIFIGGDIFHTKTRGLTPEYIELMNWWLTSMAEIAPVHMILGNHDGNLANMERQDAITPIVNALGNPRVHLYKQSGVYQFAPGWNWCVFSLFDTEGWGHVSPVPGDVNIACYHGSIRGAVTDVGFEFEGNTTADFFKDYDFCLLGDIHRQQFLALREVDDDAKPWIGYCGSLIQQDHGEGLRHGFLVWDIRDARSWDVEFVEVPGVHPFVTVDWAGTPAGTVLQMQHIPDSGRYRIKSDVNVPQHAVRETINLLKERKHAAEVTFKIDQKISNELIETDNVQVLRQDLHSVSVQIQLMRDFYRDAKVSERDWAAIEAYLAKSNVGLEEPDTVRNVKWRIKSFEFDNLFSFGEGNVINFDRLKGLVGLFGKNRSGKSSVVGALMYTLFNESDRGAFRNIEMVKSDKDWAQGRITVSIDGVDHMIERRTQKGVNKKKNEVYANTVLKCSQLGREELTGTERTDTERVIRQLIGDAEDFTLTSLSTQSDLNRFISEGSTRRRQVVSKFLDLDFFDRLHDVCKRDVAETKAQLKNLPERDWSAAIDDVKQKRAKADELIAAIELSLDEHRLELSSIASKLKALRDQPIVSPADYDSAADSVARQELTVTSLERAVDAAQKMCATNEESLRSWQQRLLPDAQLNEVKMRIASLQHLRKACLAAKRELELATIERDRRRKSISVLGEVPCGDSFPTCRFIKDSHADRATMGAVEQSVVEKQAQFDELTAAIASLEADDPATIVSEQESIASRLVTLEKSCFTSKNQLQAAQADLAAAMRELERLTLITEDLEKKVEAQRAEEFALTSEKFSSLSHEVKELSARQLKAAGVRGMCEAEIVKLEAERLQFHDLSTKLKIQDLVVSAFSRRGIPNLVISRQLPAINAEIAKILYGIVDFTVELQASPDSNDMPIIISYGDYPRLIELASGMEKMIASIAIRVALFNVSTLPKTDIFIIDEGFGVLDDEQIDPAVRLLHSLKQFFHSIIVITHVDVIKEAVDDMIEITRHGKDARVTF